MRVEGRYSSLGRAEAALSTWRGLYGDSEADPRDRYFRVRHLPGAEGVQRSVDAKRENVNKWWDETKAERARANARAFPYAVVSFTDLEEADAVDAEGEVKA